MIRVTDLRGNPRYVNAELIESISCNPDTQIVFMNGHRLYTSESPEILTERIIAYRYRCHVGPLSATDAATD